MAAIAEASIITSRMSGNLSDSLRWSSATRELKSTSPASAVRLNGRRCVSSMIPATRMSHDRMSAAVRSTVSVMCALILNSLAKRSSLVSRASYSSSLPMSTTLRFRGTGCGSMPLVRTAPSARRPPPQGARNRRAGRGEALPMRRDAGECPQDAGQGNRRWPDAGIRP